MFYYPKHDYHASCNNNNYDNYRFCLNMVRRGIDINNSPYATMWSASLIRIAKFPDTSAQLFSPRQLSLWITATLQLLAKIG